MEPNILMRVCFALLIAAGLQGASYEGTRVIRSVVRADASGKLVRSVVVNARPVPPRTIEPAAPAAAPAPAGALTDIVNQIANQHRVEPELVHSVIRVESNYNAAAVSSKGALGIMQLIPSTARRFGVANVFNPVDNIQGGVRYLRYLLDLFGGDYRLALAGYNAGEAAVARYGGIPPYPETRSYVYQVGRKLGQARTAGRAQPAPLTKAPGALNSVQEIAGPDGAVRYITR
jgi:soluble lytic murein transglycosylase-like protein